MKLFIHILILLTLAINVQVFAQVNYSVTGVVTDAATGEPIIGAILRTAGTNVAGTVTDIDGQYRLILPAGDYYMTASVTGYKISRHHFTLRADTTINFVMRDTSYIYHEVVITAERPDENISSAQMGAVQIDMKEAEKLPVLFGEKDILKTAQLLPGIKSGGDGGSGIFVRGGAADQNLVLLDDAPVFSSTHLLGFFSTFDSEMLRDVTIYKGNQPAMYGGRLSSALDVRMRNGDNRKFHAGGGIGLISSRIFAEGPIVPGKSSFLFGARRTYADIFLGMSKDSSINNNRLYFYDLHGKLNFQIGERDALSVSGYYGRDYFGVDRLFGVSWGNATASIRWNHTTGHRSFSSTNFIVSDYNYKIDISATMDEVAIRSKIRSYSFKEELACFPDEKHAIHFGVNSIYHIVTPGQLEAAGSASFNPVKLDNKYGWENAVYFSDEWTVSDRFSVIYGVRLSAFSMIGPGKFYSFDEAGEVTDSVHAGDNAITKTYFNVEPRISAALVLSSSSSVKWSYSRNTQNLHLLSNSVASSPTDVWIMNGLSVKPEVADLISAGYYRNFRKNTIEFSAEIYYKHMQDQIDFRNGADLISNERIEGELLFGNGRAYGLELFLKRKEGKFTGWISYTLSRSERRINGINSNAWYPVRQDRTHDIAIVVMYELNTRWSLSATWVYGTGNAVTFPEAKYYVDGQIQFIYTDRNAYRMPAYHRLDIGANCQLRKTEKFESSLNISVYNVYARENAYAITFRESQTNPGETEAVRIALFRIVPSITYNFRF